MNKGNLECIYDAIKEKRRNRDDYIDKVTELDKEIQVEILEYRIESVKRVLEYFQGLDADFDNLIVHCINKLNGNIDGIELALGDDK